MSLRPLCTACRPTRPARSRIGAAALFSSAPEPVLNRDAIVESLRLNLQPVFLASLTTALGFLSMNFSEVPPFRQLGTFVAFGVGAAFVLSVTFLPALLSLLPIRARATGHRHDAAMVALGDFVVRRRRGLLWGSGLIVVALVASIPRNELNDVFLHYFDESIEFRRDADFTVENLTGMYAMEYSLASGEPGGISDPDFLADVAAFAEWYKEQPETINVNVVTDTSRRLNMSMHGDDPAEYRLPASRELAAQYLLLYEMSLPYGLDLNNQIDVDKSATRMSVGTQMLSSNEVLALDRRALQWLADHAPNIVRSESSGTTLMFAYLGRRNIVSMLVGTTIALVGISFVLIFALRSLRLGLTSLVPNLVPGALVTGFGVCLRCHRPAAVGRDAWPLGSAISRPAGNRSRGTLVVASSSSESRSDAKSALLRAVLSGAQERKSGSRGGRVDNGDLMPATPSEPCREEVDESKETPNEDTAVDRGALDRACVRRVRRVA